MPSAFVSLPELARRLARRDGGAEANLQADVRTLLLYGGLNLSHGTSVEEAGGGPRSALTIR
jgi:hypothetical protein